MSEIRVNQIQANEDSVSFIGITTFSGTGSFGLPGGTSLKRPEVPKEGQIRYINGDVKKGLEYYNGTEWISVGVANGSVVEGTTPIGVFGGLGSVIDYVAITSLGNATTFGNLSVNRNYVATCSSSTRGVFAGGETVNVIDYITILSTGNATDFGDLTSSRRGPTGCSSNTRGIFAGGGNPGPVYSYTGVNTVDYITIATIGDATTFGQLNNTGVEFPGSCSSSTRGIFAGGAGNGNASPYGIINSISYVTISTIGNSITFGQLTAARAYSTAGCSSSTRGVFAGGYSAVDAYFNTIDYITIATLSNATYFGDLTVERYGNGACSSSTRGVFGGGQTSGGATNVIDYITIATTGNAIDFGDLTSARSYPGQVSNNHGGLLAS